MSRYGSSWESSRGNIYSDRLRPSFAASEREKWLVLSSAPVFDTWSPPLVCLDSNSRFSDTGIYSTNKASMLRMQCSLQNNTQKIANKVENKMFALKSKVPIMLKRETELSHGFLLGSRYNSAHYIDTRSLKKCGLFVPRDRKHTSFNNKCITQNHGHASSFYSSAGSTRKIKQTLITEGTGHSADTLEHSASLQMLKRAHPAHPHVISDSGATSGYGRCAKMPAASSCSSNKIDVVEENQSDLLSPEAHKLARQVVMSELEISMKLPSQDEEEGEAAQRGNIVDPNTFPTPVPERALSESDEVVSSARKHFLVSHAEGIEDTVASTRTTSSIVVDLTSLIARSREDPQYIS